VFYKQVIDTESYNANSMKLFPYDPSDTYENSIIRKPAILSLCPKMIMKVQDSQTLSTSTDPYSTVPNYSKALPSGTDYERLSDCTIGQIYHPLSHETSSQEQVSDAKT
jgi:hypothetical protein